MINLENTTPFEIIENLDLRKIADDELEAVIKGLVEERENRKQAKEKMDWEKLVKAIKDYTIIYGSISIENEIWVDENSTFTEPGEIWA